MLQSGLKHGLVSVIISISFSQVQHAKLTESGQWSAPTTIPVFGMKETLDEVPLAAQIRRSMVPSSERRAFFAFVPIREDGSFHGCKDG